MKTKICSLRIFALLALAFGISASPYGALAQSLSPGAMAEKAALGLSNMEQAQIHAGRALLYLLVDAKTAVGRKLNLYAEDVLRDASALARAIDVMTPAVTIADQVELTKNKLLPGTETVGVDAAGDFLPIYASLEALKFIVPAPAGKALAKVKEAEKHVAGGDRKRAAKLLGEVAYDIKENVIYLPVSYVEGQVDAADKALNQQKPDFATAAQALDNALTTLLEGSSEVIELKRIGPKR